MGSLPVSYCQELIMFLGQIHAAKDDILRECAVPAGSIALAIAPSSVCWWGFYELSVSQTVQFVANVLGLAEAMREAGRAENPQRTLMELFKGDVAARGLRSARRVVGSWDDEEW